jgi:hypothetical protein
MLAIWLVWFLDLTSPESLWLALSVEPDQQALAGQAEWSEAEEWKRYCKRQEMLAAVVTGGADPDDLLDCLLEQSISVDDYLEETDENLIWWV